jgi:hypothetical protein
MITGNGILSDLSAYNVPWKEDITDGLINQILLDISYFQDSADKVISPFIWQIAGLEEYYKEHYELTSLTELQRSNIAGVVYTMMNRKWERLWNLYKLEYNPIQNYNITEEETIDTDTTTETTDTGTVTTVTDADSSQTGTVADASNGSRNDGVFGFNSSSAVGSDTSNGTYSNTRTDNLASTNDATETETRNLAGSNTGTRDVDRSLTRSGNIGVTTTQKMVESELEVWKWNFFRTVFRDISEICCLDIY